MKKSVSLLLTVFLLFTVAIFPSAASNSNVSESTSIIHTDFGDIQVDSTLIIFDSLSRADSRSAKHTETFRYDGKVIATVTLSATFGYDGKSAWVEKSSSSHTTSGGWSYGNETIKDSGNTVFLSARLSKFLYPSVDFTLSMTCSPNSEITSTGA